MLSAKPSSSVYEWNCFPMPPTESQDAEGQQDIQFRKALGLRLRAMRKERGWTLRDMVVLHRFHLSAWGGFESGRIGMSLRSLLRVAVALGVHPAELLAGLEIPEAQAPAQDVPANAPAKTVRKRVYSKRN